MPIPTARHPKVLPKKVYVSRWIKEGCGNWEHEEAEYQQVIAWLDGKEIKRADES